MTAAWQPPPTTAARWMVIGEWRAHPARLVIGALAIAVGVALGFAVHLVNQTALASFDRAVRTVNGAADLQIRAATPAGFAESLYPRIARTPGVAAASPVVEIVAFASASTTGTANPAPMTLLGLDVLRAAAVTPSLIGLPPDRSSPFDPDAIFLSRAALTAAKKNLGDRITLTAANTSRSFTIAGILANTGNDQAIAVIDIADAQWRFAQLGKLQRIDIRLAQGMNRAAAMAAINARLPADARLVSPENAQASSDSLSRAYRVNLEMLAMVALLTGGFLVYSAQSLSVARRRPQFALLRVLGLRPGALTVQIVLEGAIVGLIGAGLGIAIGYGLADLAVTLLGGDLGGGLLGRGEVHLDFSAPAALVFAMIGIAVAIASSLVPALEAARAKPAIALKNAGDTTDPRHRPAGWPGLVLLGLGGLAALGPPIAELPLLGYAAMALLLAGGVAAMPFLARALLAPLQNLSLPAPLDLALKRLWGAPQQAAVALCGIVASTSLMVAMAVMVSSFRGSVDDWLVQILPSDVYLHIEGAETAGLDPTAQARLAATPGVAKIRFLRQIPLRLAADRAPVILTGQPDPAASIPLIGRTIPVPAGEVAAYISEPMVWLYNLKPGDRMNLPLGGKSRPVFIAGVWRDYARQFGAITLADRDFTALTGDRTRSEAAIDTAPGTDPAKLITALRQRLGPVIGAQAMFAEPRQMRAVALSIFDRSFAITYALEAIAIVIGLVGVAATFSAQTLARTREFGMLRHIGVRRGQIMTMLAAEGALLGIIGVIAGLALGVLMSQVLIHVVNPQSFHWTMDTRIPWPLFAGLAAALTAAAAGTAALAGRRAVSADAIRAVREDW
ncbi:permease [Polymorphobacter glacialis]|uniref:Permease n=1 Tax=Sandarakinorhabdus glacialis TaxID=1614636 RepID=A0A917E7F8_9SPHN|nr:FtsX-like permease family protein [Polymorphobacter glacialis]GGE11659.1 permease [Polymorphobacter glacialis]